MNPYVIFGIYLHLLKNRQATAKELADRFEISSRSVYRYIDALSVIGVPIITKQGRNGGVELLGDFYIDGLSLTKADKQILSEFVATGKKIDMAKEIIKKIL